MYVGDLLKSLSLRYWIFGVSTLGGIDSEDKINSEWNGQLLRSWPWQPCRCFVDKLKSTSKKWLILRTFKFHTWGGGGVERQATDAAEISYGAEIDRLLLNRAFFW